MRLSAIRPYALLVLVAVLATIGMTWPLAANAAGSVQDLGDPLLQIWTLKWDLHQLARDPLRLYEANTFQPFPSPLAYSESMLGVALLYAPVWWLTGNDVLAYNLIVLFTFAASIVTATLLARELTARWPAALLAGLAFAFLPYRFGHLSHLNLLSLQWLPLVLWCLVRFLRTSRPAWAVGFTVAFLLQALSSFYYAYLAAVACAIVLLVRPPWRDGRPSRPRLLGLVGAGLAIALVMTPVSLPYFAVRQVMAFERTAQDVDELAATPKSYVSVAPDSRLYRRQLPERYPNPLFPGFAVAALAVVGAVTVRRRLTLALLALGAVGLVLSFGFSVNVGGREVPLLYGWLYDYLPGARGLRDVARWGVLPLLAAALLAAAGLGWLMDRIAGDVTRPWRRWAATGLAVAVAVVALAEFASGAVRAVPVERDEATLAPYRWLAEQQEPGLVVEFPADGVRTNVTRPTRYMYYSTYHWLPHLLGYSGFVPPLHYELAAAFPDDRRTATPSHLNAGNVGLLRDLGVRYILFHRFAYSGGGWRIVQENLAQIDGLTLAGQFGQTWVYLLEPGKRRPVQAEMLLPNRALTGAPYLAHYVLQNPNPTRAAHAFGGTATLSVAWRDGAGRLVATASAALQPGAIVEPGTRLTPVNLGPTPAPGDYLLAVTSADARLAPLLPAAPTPVTVLAALPDTATEPPRLRQISWPAGPFTPGQPIPVALTWEATGPVPGHVVFCQLIGPDNKVWGQRDGQPLDGRRPATAWLPGERIDDRRDLPVAPEASPGGYRLLTGLYDPATGRRLPIVGPDGTLAPEVWSPEIVISGRP
ncbi:MAG: hypothetical protein IT340_08940 [Chloroflexi bacterium]|nr:hypothetical protein [Chloroflexota bacterium]